MRREDPGPGAAARPRGLFGRQKHSFGAQTRVALGPRSRSRQAPAAEDDHRDGRVRSLSRGFERFEAARKPLAIGLVDVAAGNQFATNFTAAMAAFASSSS